MPASVDPSQLSDLFAQHRQEISIWEAACSAVEQVLSDIARKAWTPARVEARAKDSGSVLGKAMRENELDLRADCFRDLAGARIVVPFDSSVPSIVEAIHGDERLEVIKEDAKQPGPDQLTYRGVHLDVRLLPSEEFASDLLGVPVPLYCEVQVKTSAQSLWSEMSHLIAYKRDLPEPILRRVNRLVALCELFDTEADSAMAAAREEGTDTAVIGAQLTRLFYGLTGRTLHAITDDSLLTELVESIPAAERAAYPSTILRFVEDYFDRLRFALTDEPEARKLPLLHRPESLLIFERLTYAPFIFSAYWGERYDPRTLDSLRSVWGTPATSASD